MFTIFLLPLQRFSYHITKFNKVHKQEIMKKNKKGGSQFFGAAIVCIIMLVGIVVFFLYTPMLSSDKTEYVYIDTDDNADSVYAKLEPVSNTYSLMALKTLARHLSYGDNIRTGRYAIEPSTGSLTILRNLRNGHQSPLQLTVPSVRTIDRLAAELSERLMLNENDLLDSLTDQAVCQRYGLDTLTIGCLFIPNTYEIFWNTSVTKLLDRMDKERKAFWTDERQKKAKDAGLTEVQVITLASIVDEETANNGEKPKVAGMYINRLNANMPLQADPTIKYAWKEFGLKRIYNKLLFIDSPFNTYRNTGLPPGPIRIPSVAGIDAVLNYVHHNYMYMCAKEDFSGTHNFAVTYDEHLKNAAKYTAALNARNIK